MSSTSISTPQPKKDSDSVSSGSLTSIGITERYLKLPEPVVDDLIAGIKGHVEAVKQGNLERVDGMLLHQAIALQSIFTELALRAERATSLQSTQILLRLALKAQSNSRATLDALINSKQPKQIAFVRQANVAQNQQVNNGVSESREGKKRNAPNELIVEEDDGGKKVDGRAAKAASRTHSKAKTLVPIDRATEH